MTARRAVLVLGLAATLGQSACTTVAGWVGYFDHVHPKVDLASRVYIGTRLDFWGVFGDHEDPANATLGRLFALIDLPFSLVADTILLPLALLLPPKGIEPWFPADE